jgi:hypothetical protein
VEYFHKALLSTMNHNEQNRTRETPKWKGLPIGVIKINWDAALNKFFFLKKKGEKKEKKDGCGCDCS